MTHFTTLFIVFVLPLALLAGPALVQRVGRPLPADTLRRQRLDEVVVTATRTEKSLLDVAIPVLVLSTRQVKSVGSLHLGDVLREQTGLSLAADHGQGIQLQGLNSECVLILVDGELLIGRTAGTLDLTRVAVGNIQRVEVVKEPASALWGSDALAGVVNIITQKPQLSLSGSLRARYGSNQTADFSGTLNAGGQWATKPCALPRPTPCPSWFLWVAGAASRFTPARFITSCPPDRGSTCSTPASISTSQT